MSERLSHDEQAKLKIYRTNVRKAVDLDGVLRSEVEAALRVIDECVGKFKITIALPFILENLNLVCELVADADFNKNADFFKRCMEKVSLYEGRGDFCAMSTDTDILQMIATIQKYYHAYDLIACWSYKPNHEDTNFIEALINIKKIASQRFFQDPKAELILEKQLNVLYNDNKQFLEYIDKFQIQAVRKRSLLRWRIVAKKAATINLETDFQSNHNERKKVYETETKICANKLNKLSQVNKFRLREAQEDMERADERLAKVFKYNSMSEAEVRAERNKLQLQLSALIKKYDHVFGEKFKQNMTLTAELEATQKDFDDFFEFVFLKAEANYQSIMTAAENKKGDAFKEKLKFFVENRAARIIQREWKRVFKIIRNERGEEKPKKGGKGKK